jgi:hypothetical protein
LSIVLARTEELTAAADPCWNRRSNSMVLPQSTKALGNPIEQTPQALTIKDNA